MKRQQIALGFLVVAVLVLAAGCDLFGRSIDATISKFQDYLNTNDRSQIYTILDSSASKYSQVTGSYWDNGFPKGETYTISASGSGTSASGTISSTTTYSGGKAIVFSFTKNGFDNVISSIVIAGTTIFN